MKQLFWLGNSRSRLKEFPPEAQHIAGYQLFQVQCGDQPDDWRPMPSVGQRITEIRIHRPNEYRVLYIATYLESVYVLHCFEKKTNKTPIKHFRIARKNYADLQKNRQKQNK